MSRWIGRAASAAVALLAFAFAFNKLDDFDTWWHLASGRWIAAHGAVPVTDTLSHTVRDQPWINVQWAFDLGLYQLHAIGGPVLLCAAGAIAFAAAIVLLLRLTATYLNSSVAALIGLLVVLAASERVALRPELLSFVLLAAVLTVLDLERRGNSRWLPLLVPLMIVWANVHALFVLGAFAIACALIGQGKASSRRFLLVGAAALVSVLVNPYGLTGALFPLKLVSRINGSTPVFATIAEFASPFAPDAPGLAIVFYKIVLAIGILAALWAMASRRRSTLAFDWGGLLFCAGLAAVSYVARRNVAIFAIGVMPFIARSLATVTSASPWFRGVTSRRASLIGAAVLLSAVSLTAAEVTGALNRWDRQPREFGAGVIEGTFPIRAVAFARAAQLPGKLYNDMAAGGYLTWDDPIGDGVFVDGRLEVYDTPFLTDAVMAMSDPIRWQRDADRYHIQTAIIFHRLETSRALAGRLVQRQDWTLVFADDVAAVFVRTRGNDAALARAFAMRPQWDEQTEAWLSQSVPRWPYRAGRVESTRAYARFMATTGHAELAITAYAKYLELGPPVEDEIDVRLLLMKFFAGRNRLPEAREQALRILAIDPHRAEALAQAR